MSLEKTAVLHSRYNPQAEADRYIASLALNEATRFFILIEPGLGYMIAPLRKRAGGAKIIALHADADATSRTTAPDVEQNSALSPPDSSWCPGAGIALQDFLEREIPDSAAAEIHILEWRPARAVYGGEYLRLIAESAEFIKRVDANLRTINAFGTRWFKNFFRNLEIIRNVIRPAPLSLPLLVTSSGPSLEDAIPLIQERAQHGALFILAVSSSVPALAAAGIQPTMVITTDGGQWANFHLFDLFHGESRAQHLAAALTAALPSQCAALPILPMSDGSVWQALILSKLAIPFIALPQRGTVSASALDVAFALTSGDVFIAGLDLENSGIRAHARPYSLDRLIEEKSGRLAPCYSQAFKRAALLQAGGSFGIYASWFAKQLAAYPRQIYSLGKNNRVFESFESAGKSAVRFAAANTAQTARATYTTHRETHFQVTQLGASRANAAQQTAKKAYAILENALTEKTAQEEQPPYAAELRKELGILLVGKSNPTPQELLEKLSETLHAIKKGSRHAN